MVTCSYYMLTSICPPLRDRGLYSFFLNLGGTLWLVQQILLEYDGIDAMGFIKLHHKKFTHTYSALLGRLLSGCRCHIGRVSELVPGGDTIRRGSVHFSQQRAPPRFQPTGTSTIKHTQMILGPNYQLAWTMNHPSWGLWHGALQISQPSCIPFESPAQRICKYSKMGGLYHYVLEWFGT